MTTSITVYYDREDPSLIFDAQGNPLHADDKELLQDALLREWRRDHGGSRRQISIWALNHDGYSPAAHATYYRGSIVGRRDRHGSWPVLAEAHGIIYRLPLEERE